MRKYKLLLIRAIYEADTKDQLLLSFFTRDRAFLSLSNKNKADVLKILIFVWKELN